MGKVPQLSPEGENDERKKVKSFVRREKEKKKLPQAVWSFSILQVRRWDEIKTIFGTFVVLLLLTFIWPLNALKTKNIL